MSTIVTIPNINVRADRGMISLDEPEPTTQTDFSEYTSEEIPDDWTQQWSTSDVAWSVEDEVGATGDKVLECVRTSNGRTALTWDEAGTAADQEVFLRMRNGSTSGTDGVRVGAVLRASGGVGTEQGYVLAISWTDGRGVHTTLGKYVGGTFTEIEVDLSFTWVADTFYNARFQIIDDALKGRFWEAGSSEPGTWDFEETDTDIASGALGIFTFHGSTSAVDAFSWATGGGSAATL